MRPDPSQGKEKDMRTSRDKTIEKNVLGGTLAMCCNDPVTGFYRNGFCQTDRADIGTHIICAYVTDEFLTFSQKRGNDLITPRPEYNFPGLKPGDKWCLCASRWTEALEAGVAPPVVLDATHEKMREYVEIEVLKKYAFNHKTSTPDTPVNAYEFSFQFIDGGDMPLSDFSGRVILVVNTASQCGFTEQYKDLQILYDTYKDQGLVVIGVPCNQFAGQEPWTEQKISEFVSNQYGITFPMTGKAHVKGRDIHPFFEWAKNQNKGGFLFSSPKWNFHKFLIDREGQLVKSFGSQVNPTSSKIKQEIERLL